MENGGSQKNDLEAKSVCNGKGRYEMLSPKKRKQKQKRVKVEKRNELDKTKMKAMEERGTNGDGGKDKTDFAPTGYIDVKMIYDLRDVRLCRPSLRSVILLYS